MTMHGKCVVAATLAACAGMAIGQETGPSSSVEPYVLGGGVRTISLLTVGDAVPGPAGADYRLVGIPDGMGGIDNGDGTITVYVQHELGAAAGVARAHGGTGAFISAWVVNTSTLEVLGGRDAIESVQVWDSTTGGWTSSAAEAIDRLCSADLAPVSAFFHDGLGTEERIWLGGEETRPPFAPDHGRLFATVLSGADAGTAYEASALGKMAFENALASPFPQKLTIVIPMDDADRQTDPTMTVAPSEVYVYVGEKQDTGNDVEKAGLANGNLWGMQITVGGSIVTEESDEFGLGDGAYVGEGQFQLFNFGDVRGKTGVELQTESIDNDIARLQRIEDGVWDTRPGKENDFYFVTTASFSGNSRLWRMRFDDITDPAAGGTIEILLKGDEGQKMMDNVGMDRFGNLLIQEDPGGNDRLARIWLYNVDDGRLVEIAEHNPKFFEPGSPDLLTTNEEASGIFDATDLLGSGWHLLDVQAHYDVGDPELVEGGQVLAMYVPLSSDCYADFNGDDALDLFDFLAFQNAFAADAGTADCDLSGSLDFFDFLCYQNKFAAGCP